MGDVWTSAEMVEHRGKICANEVHADVWASGLGLRSRQGLDRRRDELFGNGIITGRICGNDKRCEFTTCYRYE